MVNLLANLTLILLILASQLAGAALPVLANAAEVPQAAAQHIRVPAQMGLQEAINQISNGGVIEVAAGSYASPSQGFQIGDLHKGFTIRGEAGTTVTLDGGGARALVRFINSSVSAGGPVVFQNLTFANGYSNTAGLAGGVTLMNAQATFLGCRFNNNSAGASGVGGGTLVANNSTALFIDSSWQNNSAVNYGAGMAVATHSRVYIHRSLFSNNRTNLVGHAPSSSGGAIHTGNSILRISNTRFEGNEAGYTGGGVFAIGTWGDSWTTDVIVANSTFINNKAANHSSVNPGAPTEGGALTLEAQVSGRVYTSRFITNSANAGGAVSIYQASLQVENSAFLGNWVTVNSAGQGGCGGAITAGSNDTPEAGGTNRPSASLNIQDSFFQGRYGSTTYAAQGGGGIYIAGDLNRTYGWNGVSQMGSAASNRGLLTVNRSAFVDLDVQKSSGGAMGGAIFSDLGSVTLQDSLVVNSDAAGSNGSGGGIALIDQSLANISGTTFARDTAAQYGAAVFSQGAELNLSSSSLVENTVGSSYGSAIFTATDTNFLINQTGVVQGNTLSNNSGSSAVNIFDDDRDNASLPINATVYNNNHFYDASSTIIYSDSLAGASSKTVSGLNSLTVSRPAKGISTVKSPSHNNVALTSAAVAGALVIAPGILPSGAAGDSGAQPAYLAYANSGGSAALDGASVGKAGVIATTTAGLHTLAVGSTNFSASAASLPTPGLSFSTQKSGSGYVFSWNVTAGSYLDAFMDQGVSITPAASGSVSAAPPVSDMTYYFYALTKEGGAAASVTLGAALDAPASLTWLVGLNQTARVGYIPIQNAGTDVLQWNASTADTGLLRIDTPSGQTATVGAVRVNILASKAGSYQGSVLIDAGSGGSKTVTVNVKVVNTLYQRFLPGIEK